MFGFYSQIDLGEKIGSKRVTLKLVRMVVLRNGVWTEVRKGSHPLDTATLKQFMVPCTLNLVALTYILNINRFQHG